MYGQREQHKGRMASVAFHLFNQYRAVGHVKLFEGWDGYANGEQLRDFVSIDDVGQGQHAFPRSSGKVRAFSILAPGMHKVLTTWRWLSSTPCAPSGRCFADTGRNVSSGIAALYSFSGAIKGEIPELYPSGYARSAWCRLFQMPS
ncbi:MAG: hypothetical protein WDM70_08000 [Nitrosomonadales bacterium]